MGVSETENCFALKNNGCAILTARKCKRCSFGKTREQLDMERAQSIRRLKSMGIWEYYKGKYELSDGGG